MRVLHLDTGKTLRGGQFQLGLLVRALDADSTVLAPVPVEGVPCEPFTFANFLRHSRRADVIHCHDARSHTFAAIWSRRPFVVSRRVVFPVRTGLLSRWKYARAAHYLAISRAVESQLTAAGVPAAKISIVPDATGIPAHLSTRTGGIVALDSDDPGKGGALLRSTGLDIHFSRNLPVDLASARVFVYVTGSEGLGSAALLAMAYGVPVVASRVGGLPEAVVDGETGLLVENAPDVVTAAVRRLTDDPALAQRLGMAGRARVEEHFTVALMAQATLAVYRKVIA